MTQLFISHTQENLDCAQQMRTDLVARGYLVWRDLGQYTLQSASYAPMIENALLASAAVVLVWSRSAAQAVWVERHLLFAQRLKKPIFPVVLDGTPLPNTLIPVSAPLMAQSACSDVVAALLALPEFPAVQSADPFLQVCELATHEYIRERKTALDLAAEMLKQGMRREEVLALLEYLAQNDLIMSVREKAEEVLQAAQAPALPLPIVSLSADESRHIFGVRCKNGHVSYFDKRQVCSAHTKFTRSLI